MYLNLLKIISNVPGERIAFFSENTKIRYTEILHLHCSNLVQLKSIDGAIVAIRANSRLNTALLLCLLDGHVNKILFIPNDIDDDLRTRFYIDAKVDCEVSLQSEKIEITKLTSFINSKLSSTATEWIIPTSGTTKVPRLINHTLNSLTRSTIHDIDNGSKFVWGLVFDVYRFSGIQVLLQSLFGGSSLIIPESDCTMSRIVSLLCEFNCNILSATPTFWRKALMAPGVEKLQLKRITLGGEIADKYILDALQQNFPSSKITHIYALTEIGVGFSVGDGQSGFPRAYLDKPLESGTMLMIKDGTLWINPGQSKINNRCTKDTRNNSDTFVNTGDLVEVIDDRVYFLGRESGAINVGGFKVQPEEVETVLLESKLLKAAYVYSKKSPIMGSLVCADLIPNIEILDKSEFKKNIINYCKKKLDPFKVPMIINIVHDLNINQNGKLVRS